VGRLTKRAFRDILADVSLRLRPGERPGLHAQSIADALRSEIAVSEQPGLERFDVGRAQVHQANPDDNPGRHGLRRPCTGPSGLRNRPASVGVIEPCDGARLSWLEWLL
jgi:hypothetical protein